MKEAKTLTANGKRYDYTLERKRMKNLTLRVHPDGSIRVSAPERTALTRIEGFLRSHTGFIDQTRQRFEAKRAANPPLFLQTGDVVPIYGFPCTVCVTKAQKRLAFVENGRLYLGALDPDNHAERAKCFAEFLDREARLRLTARVAELAPLFAPRPPKTPSLVFRTMKTKWGICRPARGEITLNRNLVFLPPVLVDYVLYHELAHFHHADHSTAFWEYLSAHLPDCKERRKALGAFPIPVFAPV